MFHHPFGASRPLASPLRSRARRPGRARLGLRPGTESLETRLALSTVVWSGDAATGRGNWSVGSNWQGGAVPGPGDDVVFPDIHHDTGYTLAADQGPATYRSITIRGNAAITGSSTIELTDGISLATPGNDWAIVAPSLKLDTGRVSVDRGTLALTGDVAGSAGLSVVGVDGGQLALSHPGELSYTGATTLVGAKLLLGGSLSADSDLTIGAGSTVFGGGAFASITSRGGSIQLNDTPVQTLTTGSLSLDADSTLVAARDATGAQGHIAIVNGGPVTLGGSYFPAAYPGYEAQVGDTFTPIVGAGSVTGAFDTFNGGWSSAFGQFFSANPRGGPSGRDYVATATPPPVTTAVTPSTGSAALGNPVALTAAVSTPIGTAGGSIAFRDGSTLIGTAPIVDGRATLAANSLAVGNHSIRTSYLGNGTFAAGGQGMTSVVITQGTTSVAVAPVSGAIYSHSVSLVANLTDSSASLDPTGSVTFLDGTTVLGTAPIVGGSARLDTRDLGIAANAITATYAGDVNFAGSTSPITQVNVDRAPIVVNLDHEVTRSVTGEFIFLGMSVINPTPVPAVPTGTVVLSDNGTVIKTMPLTWGGAILNINSLGVGTHSLTATYSGDSLYAPNTSAVLTQVVDFASVHAGITLTPSSGGASKLVATLGADAPGSGNPTGTVTFVDGSTTLGTAPIRYGVASLDGVRLGAGSHAIAAIYSGDAGFYGRRFEAGNLTPPIRASTFGLTSPQPATTFGQALTLTARVTTGSGSVNSGTVGFYDGSTVLGFVPVSNGVAQLTVSNLGLGSHTILAGYSGDATTAPSGGGSLTQTVVAASTTTTLLGSTTSTPAGAAMTYVAIVAPIAPGAGTPGGYVTFFDGSTAIGVAGLVGGQAVLNTTAGSAGSHAIHAVYAGDPLAYGVSTSAPFALNVVAVPVVSPPVVVTPPIFATQVNPTLTFAYLASARALNLGVSVVNPAGGAVATGTVTFLANGRAIATQSLANGSAGLSLTKAAALNKTISVVYSGDANLLGASSASFVATRAVFTGPFRPVTVFRAAAARSVRASLARG